MGVPFAFRNSLEQMLRAIGVHEVQARQAAFGGPHGFDLTSWKPKKRKAYKQPRPDPPDLIVVHVTDVTGGFGVSKRRVKHWAAAFRESQGLVSGTPLPAYIPEIPSRGSAVLNAARRIALWERFRNLPYHQIGAHNGDVIVNHDLMRWSWHGNAGNRRGVGWAMDVGNQEPLDEFLIETGRASLRALIKRINETDPYLIDVAPHRAYSAQRRIDTNLAVWSEIVKPVVGEFEHVRIDYEARVGRGRPVPRRWDPDALFDWRGRRL